MRIAVAVLYYCRYYLLIKVRMTYVNVDPLLPICCFGPKKKCADRRIDTGVSVAHATRLPKLITIISISVFWGRQSVDWNGVS